jgi:hypothetical protein
VGRCAGGMDRAPFERAMHAFMRTVLLRGGGMNALMLNAVISKLKLHKSAS